ncbi:MAG: hypothetical protein CL583_01870 [Alteromonadaceae bacterium]|nr:hypothetical protein [Alteromonadaceae bacterium]|tara:strand:- start:434 stop:673 length:240 start_codon:yes stop_codon:yes gene_type:complete
MTHFNPATVIKKLRAEAAQFTVKSLAEKFERNNKVITRIRNWEYVDVPEWEQELIRACLQERERLLFLARALAEPEVEV